MSSVHAGSLSGQTVGNYQVVSQIGSGAMGEVYLAEHPQIGRRVAVKILVPQYSSNAEVSARFMSEARAVNTINHPNIIQIFDFGQLADGRLYYTMEFLEGSPLTDFIQDRAPLSLREAEEILRQTAEALDAAHAAGIVHRDLKPDNIFVRQTPTGLLVKVLDFGIAKLLDSGMGSQHRTSTGMIMGTPLYMSPEQAAGQTHLISARSDIYALGVILFQMLSGRLPIEAPTTAQVLAKHIAEPHTPLETVTDGLPPGVCVVVNSALAKEPQDRPQTAGLFLLAFRQACVGADMNVAPTGVDGPVVRPPGASVSGAFEGRLGTGPTTLGSMASETVGGEYLPRRRTGLWVGMAAALLVALGVGGYFALGLGGKGKGDSGGSRESAATGSGEAGETASAREPGAREPGSREGGSREGGAREGGAREGGAREGGAREGGEARPSGSMSGGLTIYRLDVKTSPTGALVEVTVAGQPTFRRRAPFQLEAKEGERVSLKAMREGYLDQSESLLATSSRTVALELERRRSGVRAMAPVRSPPREPPAMDASRRPPTTSTVGEGTLRPTF